MNKITSEKLVDVQARINKLNEYHRKYNAQYRITHAKQVYQYNSRYLRRQRLILKLLTQNPDLSFEDTRALAFEQIPTPRLSPEQKVNENEIK